VCRAWEFEHEAIVSLLRHRTSEAVNASFVFLKALNLTRPCISVSKICFCVLCVHLEIHWFALFQIMLLLPPQSRL